MVFDVLIAVSSEIEQSLSSLGPVKLIPAYIPTHNDQASLSPATRAFLRDGTNVVVAAYRLSVDRRGRMIYGLETAIRSFAAVARARSDLRLAIFLASAPSSRRQSDRLRLLIEGVDDEDVRRRIGVFCGEPLAPALPLAALYLRPTLTDGDAVSIREAIAAGVPVLASDVVVRPPGVGPCRWTHPDGPRRSSRPSPGGNLRRSPEQQPIRSTSCWPSTTSSAIGPRRPRPRCWCLDYLTGDRRVCRRPAAVATWRTGTGCRRGRLPRRTHRADPSDRTGAFPAEYAG